MELHRNGTNEINGGSKFGIIKKVVSQKNTDEMNFSSIKTHEMALELYQKNILVLLYIVPLKFGGEDESNNILYVPQEIVNLKQRYDDVAEKLLLKGNGARYICTPEYKNKSFVPSALHIMVTGKTRFTQTIKIW